MKSSKRKNERIVKEKENNNLMIPFKNEEEDMYNKVALKFRKGDDIREYLANYERDSKAWDKLYDEAEEE